MGIFDSLFGSQEDIQRTTQTTGPPEWLRPYLQDAMGDARGLYDAGSLYPSSQVPGRTQAGYDAIAGQAMGPSVTGAAGDYATGAIGGDYLGLQDPASQYAQGVLGGDYMPGNYTPGDRTGRDALEATAGGDFLSADALRRGAASAIGDVQSSVGGALAGSGFGTSSLANEALGRGVGRAVGEQYGRERGLQLGAAGALEGEYGRERGAQGQAANLLAGRFGQERGLQAGAASMAPGLDAASYLPGQALVGAGQGQRAIEERYYQEPWERLQRYSGLAFGGAPGQLAGSQSVGERPVYSPSPFQQILGGGLAAAGAASGLGWSPFGGGGGSEMPWYLEGY